MGLQGNAAFKDGDFLGSIEHYTAAILIDGTDLTFPLNRAAAYLKLGKYVLRPDFPYLGQLSLRMVGMKMLKGIVRPCLPCSPQT
jgi:hypothetical protein